MTGTGADRSPGDGTDGIVAALLERALAQLERGSSTLRLALAETRLAASSAAALLAIAIVGAGLAIVMWVLFAALLGYLLWLLGLPPVAVLLLLLLVHACAAAALALTARLLARDLGFAHTRQALAGDEPAIGDELGATPAAPETGRRALP